MSSGLVQLPTGSEILLVEIPNPQRSGGAALKRFKAYWDQLDENTVTYKVAFKGQSSGPACVLFNIPIDLLQDTSWPAPVINLELLMFYPECCQPDLVKGESKHMLKAACKRVWTAVKDVYPRVRGIDLQDESEIDCLDINGAERKVSLADLQGLVYGNTWYGRIGAQCQSNTTQHVLAQLEDLRNKPIAASKSDLQRRLRYGGHPFMSAERAALSLAYDRIVDRERAKKGQSSTSAVVSTGQLLGEINAWTDDEQGVQGCWLLNRLSKFLMNAYPDQIRSLRGSTWIFPGEVIEAWPDPRVDDLSRQYTQQTQSGGGRLYRLRQTRVRNQVDDTLKSIVKRRSKFVSA